MDTIAAREEIARLLASQDAPTLAQVLLELAEDHEPVYRSRLHAMGIEPLGALERTHAVVESRVWLMTAVRDYGHPASV